MPYVINRYNGTQLVVLEDGTLDTTTSLGLLGRNYSGYGEVQNENFLFLLENFANGAAPIRPLSGQLWYNSTTSTLNIYDGASWKSASAADVSTSEPPTGTGSFWFNPDTNQLFVYDGAEWKLVGPEAVDGFPGTKMESTTLYDTSNLAHAVILMKVNNIVQGIVSKTFFTIRSSDSISGFSTIVPGLNISSLVVIKGNVEGNSTTASRLQTSRTINGVVFDGGSDVTIKSATTNKLIKGTYLTGADFDGSVTRTWAVDASSTNDIGKVVARDSSGNFSAGTITANLIGNVVGNVSVATGSSSFNRVIANEFIGASLSGNAFSATQLETTRKINGVNFNGTSDITITSAASTLTGDTLASNVVTSFLTSVGTLNSLEVSDAGITLGSNTLKLYYDADVTLPVISATSYGELVFRVNDTSVPSELAEVSLVSGQVAAGLGADTKAMLAPRVTGGANLGSSAYRYNKVYSNYINAPIVNTETINTTAETNSVTVSSDLIIQGNLVVNGITTTINSTDVMVHDLTFTVAKDVESPINADGAGFIVGGANARLVYSATGDKWTINKRLDAGTNDIITTGLFQGTATSARYADLAENYIADAAYEPGTVLEFGGSAEVRIAEDATTRVAGVVSTDPAYLMNSHCTGQYVVALALQGRVPCKVRGKISKGDMLISGGSGYARPCTTPQIGTIIGKALEDFEGIEGIIEVAVGRI